MSPRASTQPCRPHRHSDPPLLWVGIVLGSILLHGLAFWTVRLLSTRSQVTLQTRSPSIDFIEVEPIVEPPQLARVASDRPQPVSSKPAESVAIASPKPVGASQGLKKSAPPPKPLGPKPSPVPIKAVSVNQPQPPVASKPNIQKNTRSLKPVARPTPTPSPLKPNATRKLAQVRSQPQPIASKPVRPPSPVRLAPNPRPQKPVRVRSQPQPAPQPIASKPVRSPSPVRPAPNPRPQKPVRVRSQPQPVPQPIAPKPVRSPSPTQPTPQPSPSIQATPYPTPKSPQLIQETPTPKPTPSPSPEPPLTEPNESGVVATIDVGSIRTGTRDIPDNPAQPKQKQKQFLSLLSQLFLDPKSVITLDVRLEIDETGKLAAIEAVNSLLESSQGERLAKLLFKDWEFKPAYTGGQPVYSELWLRVTIQPL